MELISILLISTFSLSLAEIPVYECDTLTPLIGCYFQNVKLNQEHFQWIPSGGDKANSVEIVEFKSSVIPVVYDNICKAFPKLTSLQLGESEVREITEDAFHLCQNLETLRLHKNKIKTLHPNTFQGLSKMEFLNLGHNEISKIPDTSFFAGIPKLDSLHLDHNNLTEFSAEMLKHNPEIVRLSLYSNDLLELDVKKLFEFLPKLTYLYWYDNQVSCSKALEGIEFIESRGLSVIACEGQCERIKDRDYEMETVHDNFKCVPDTKWEEIKARY